jgi:hypothetical protein
LSFAANTTEPLTWCCIQRLCAISCEGQYTSKSSVTHARSVMRLRYDGGVDVVSDVVDKSGDWESWVIPELVRAMQARGPTVSTDGAILYTYTI